MIGFSTYKDTAQALITLSRTVKAVRTQRGLTQQAAAKQMRIAPSTVNRIEAGHGCHTSVAVQVLLWLGKEQKS